MMSKKYKSLAEWRKTKPKDYDAAVRHKWIEGICEAMGWEYDNRKHYKKPNYWNIKENVLASAKQYKTKSEWAKFADSAYSGAKRNGWFEEATAHMKSPNKPAGYWTKERCIEEAKKYKTRNEWRCNHPTSYQAACTKKFFNECTKHMEYTRKPAGYWTHKENVIKALPNYKTYKDFREKCTSGYQQSIINNWLNEIKEYFDDLEGIE
jgi:hypothetical protein